MNQTHDMASLLLVFCIGSASFSSLQLLEQLINGFNCDLLKETGKEWFRFGARTHRYQPNMIHDCEIAHFCACKMKPASVMDK